MDACQGLHALHLTMPRLRLLALRGCRALASVRLAGLGAEAGGVRGRRWGTDLNRRLKTLVRGQAVSGKNKCAK